jgi:hypothetical protein
VCYRSPRSSLGLEGIGQLDAIQRLATSRVGCLPSCPILCAALIDCWGLGIVLMPSFEHDVCLLKGTASEQQSTHSHKLFEFHGPLSVARGLVGSGRVAKRSPRARSTPPSAYNQDLRRNETVIERFSSLLDYYSDPDDYLYTSFACSVTVRLGQDRLVQGLESDAVHMSEQDLIARKISCQQQLCNIHMRFELM